MFLGVAFQKSTPAETRARPHFTCAGALTAECTHPYAATPAVRTYAYYYYQCGSHHVPAPRGPRSNDAAAVA